MQKLAVIEPSPSLTEAELREALAAAITEHTAAERRAVFNLRAQTDSEERLAKAQADLEAASTRVEEVRDAAVRNTAHMVAVNGIVRSARPELESARVAVSVAEDEVHIAKEALQIRRQAAQEKQRAADEAAAEVRQAADNVLLSAATALIEKRNALVAETFGVRAALSVLFETDIGDRDLRNKIELAIFGRDTGPLNSMAAGQHPSAIAMRQWREALLVDAQAPPPSMGTAP